MNNLIDGFIDLALFGASFAPYFLGVAILFMIAWKTQHIWGDRFAELLGIEEEGTENAYSDHMPQEQPKPLQKYSA